jgi:hypothetical protein
MWAPLKSLVLRPVWWLGYDIVRSSARRGPRLPALWRRWRANDAIVHLVKTHLLAAPSLSGLPALGERWGAYANRLRARIADIATVDELLALAQSPDAGVETHLAPNALMQCCRFVDLGLRDILSPELIAAFDSIRSPRVALNTIDYRGRPLDFVTLCAAQTISLLLHWLPHRPRTLCDVGGGTGKYAYAWLTNAAHRPELVVIVDMPETLIYSEALLRSEFGERVQYLARPDQRPSGAGIVLCPLGNIKALANISFDLVTNSGSMQEMPDPWIDWYMGWLDRQPCRFFYSSNFFCSPLDAMEEGHNSWSPRPSSRWRLLQSRLAPGPGTTATLLFEHSELPAEAPPLPAGLGAEAWFVHLEAVRCRHDLTSLRAAADFADAMPFVPKEAWQVARMLAELSGTAEDHERFQRLDRLRKSGIEARH